MISGGKLDKRMILQAPSIARAADGSETITWTTLATIWAGITSSGGREFWQAKQTNSEISHLIAVRYRAKISPRYRLVYSGRTLEILSVVNPDEGMTELHLMCKEVVT